MHHRQTARDFIASLCYGTLYERLTAAQDLPEAVERAAAEWNDFGIILQTLTAVAIPSVPPPTIDLPSLQRRILAEYASHPLLQKDVPLVAVVDGRPTGLEALVTIGGVERAVQESRYIDRVRTALGDLRAVSYSRAGAR